MIVGGQLEGGQMQVSPTHELPATGLPRDDPDKANTARAAKLRFRNMMKSESI